MKIVTIIGARPQFIKAAPVSRAIAEHNKLVTGQLITEVIIHTGQHYDRTMSDIFFEEMHIPRPDYFLNINGLSHGAMTGQMLVEIEELLIKEKPDAVLVYGDTNTTLAGALASVKLHIPVAHVEAGLRSFNRRMPEEINRVLTDHGSTILFCPTQQAVENLRTEGIVDGVKSYLPSAINQELRAISHELPRKVALVGDVMLDTALFYAEQSSHKSTILQKLSSQFSNLDHFILCTIHRAENTDDTERLRSIFSSLERIAREVPVILPLHPRTRKLLENSKFKIQNSKLILIDPVSYFDMLELLKHCSLVMTDSGGLQKEAFFFHKPCVTLRDETEWVELIEHGFNMVAGTDAENIYQGYRTMMGKAIDTSMDLYGCGDASHKIVKNLEVMQNSQITHF